MDPLTPGRYRHHKGGEYELLHEARHSETEEELVVYRALYGEHGIWVRPRAMWDEEVRPGVRRFEPSGVQEGSDPFGAREV